MKKINKIIRKTGKIFGIIILSIIGLLLLIIGLIRIPKVQQEIVSRAETYLQDQIGTEVSIEHLYLAFPKSLDVENVYLEDQQGDTLLYFSELSVDTDLWALIDKTIELNSIYLDGLVSNIRRQPDSTFNFSYIIEAFDTGTQQPDTAATEPWQFSIEDIELNDVDVNYQDKLTSSSLVLNLGNLEIAFDEINPTESVFHIAGITLKNTDFRYIADQVPISESNSRTKGQPAKDTSATTPLNLQVGNVEILKSSFLYQTPQQNFDLSVGTFEVETNNINLEDNLYDIESILLEKTTASIALAETTGADTLTAAPDTTSGKAMPIDIRLGAFSMAGNQVNYSMGEVDSTIQGFNPNLIILRELETEMRNLHYANDKAEGTVRQLSFIDPNGLNLKEFQLNFKMDSSSITVPDFHLATENSTINLRAQTEFGSLQNFMQPQTSVEIALDNSHIGPSDMLYFNPELNNSAPLDLTELQPIEVAATARGSLEEMSIEDLRVGISRTFIDLKGTVGNLTEPQSLTFNLSQNLTSSRQDLRRLLPDSLYPEGIMLPENLELNVSLAGSINEMRGTVDLASSFGNLHLNGNYAMGKDSIPHYDLTLSTEGFNLGGFMDQPDQFGQLALNFSADGRGTAIETIHAELQGTVTRFDFQHYTYNDLYINGQLIEGMFDGQLEMNDENLDFTFTGSVNQLAREKDYQVSLDIEKVDLEALNFSKTPLIISAEIETDIRTADFQRFNGEVSIHNFSANNGMNTYRVDSLLFTSIDQEERTEISIESDLMEGQFKGNVNLLSLPEALTNHFHYYYTLQDTVIRDTLNSQQFELSLDLKKTELITELLVPQLETFNPGRLEAKFNSADRELDFSMNIKQLKYNDITIDSIIVFAASNPQNMEAGLQINHLASGSIAVPQLKLTADVEEDLFYTRLAIRDSTNEKSYLIKGTFESGDSAYHFSLDPDSLMLASEMWDVSNNNALHFGPAGFQANNFILAKGQQQIAVETLNENHRISFNEFRLKTLSNAIGKQDSLLTGTLNGTVGIAPLDTTFGFTADLSIANVAYLTEPLGTLELKAQKDLTEEYRISVTSTGANRFEIDGQYHATQPEKTQLTMNIRKIDLNSFSTLAAGAVEELYGTLTGSITIAGDLTAPDIDGRISFSETGIHPTGIGTLLKINDQTIRINNSTFRFNEFSIRDRNDNKATLSGEFIMEDATLYRFDLDFTANDFMVLNSDSEDNEMYYGTLVIDAEADITGTSVQPNVDMNVDVKEESNVSYVIPTSEYSVLDQSNVVVFKAPPGADSLKNESVAMDSLTNEFQGVEMNVNLGINEGATFNIIIDPLTGDQLTVQGTANLTIDMNRQGDLQLSGRYELNSGVYNFSFYRLVQREFNITEGSSITWTGDPLEANLDIQASYRIETSPIDLLSNQISNTTGPEYNQYRQQLPFLVYLNIEGELTEPEISFELDMPQAEQNALGGSVYGRIQDINSRESELNKQVFALLILQRFISDDPFTSEGGASLADNTRRSVSRIMSDQLNRLAENIEGVDVTFDLQSYEDYSAEGSEGRTDLEVGLSRSLFSDRVNVKVTGNVNLEGGSRQRTATDYIGDLVIEYKITEDGRIRATAFRRTDFDVINGEIIETGTGLIYVREYDVFKELFSINEDK